MGKKINKGFKGIRRLSTDLTDFWAELGEMENSSVGFVGRKELPKAPGPLLSKIKSRIIQYALILLIILCLVNYVFYYKIGLSKYYINYSFYTSPLDSSFLWGDDAVKLVISRSFRKVENLTEEDLKWCAVNDVYIKMYSNFLPIHDESFIYHFIPIYNSVCHGRSYDKTLLFQVQNDIVKEIKNIIPLVISEIKDIDPLVIEDLYDEKPEVMDLSGRNLDKIRQDIRDAINETSESLGYYKFYDSMGYSSGREIRKFQADIGVRESGKLTKELITILLVVGSNDYLKNVLEP